MKYLLPLALVAISLPGCLSAPAKVADADRAGEQVSRQIQDNSPLRMDREAEKSVVIKVNMTGEGAVLNFQPNTATLGNDGSIETGGNQGVQGSTDAAQGSTATQTPTATQDIPVDVSVPVK